MYPDSSFHKQSGAGLPTALFIITVLALLVFGMAQLQQSSGEAVSLQIQSQRAFFAAESGAQIAVTRLLAGGACPISPVDFSREGLSACVADVSCSGTGIVNIESEGICGSGKEEASRTVRVRLNEN